MLVSTALAIPQIPLSNFSAFQLLVAGALLLGIATLLLALSRDGRGLDERDGLDDGHLHVRAFASVRLYREV